MNKTMGVLLCAGVLLAGCSTMLTEVQEPERLEQVTGIDKHSSYPAIRRETFERINFLELVDPEQDAAKAFPDNWNDAEKLKKDGTVDEKSRATSVQYDLALARFRQRTDLSGEEKCRRRNSIQERMLSVSLSRCNVFKTYLRRDQADKNFLLGTATTVAGVLGAILPGADAGRVLAGSAGIFSGIRSEYNQAYYASLAAHVIVKGIETRQEIVYHRIQAEGQSKTIEAYPLEAAIKDAIYFDGLCSVVVGLDQASASIDATTEPGMEAATRTILRARLLKEATDMPGEKLLKPETIEKIGQAGAKLGLSLVGTSLGEPTGTVETDLSVAASRMNERIGAAADAAAQAIEQAALDRKKELLAPEKDPVKSKALAEAEPKPGTIVKAARLALATGLLAPLNLNGCYEKLAAAAVQERSAAVAKLAVAVKARSEAVGGSAEALAKADVARADAELALGNATRAVAAASEKLRAKERRVLDEIAAYRDQRLAAIGKVGGDAGQDTLNSLMSATQAAPTPSGAANEPGCK